MNYDKCKACLNCVLVCPRNAINVTSVTPKKVLSIKIDHEKCTMCQKCLDDSGKFCPKHLFYKDMVKKEKKEQEVIRFKFSEISKCQSCLRCEALCPEKAIKPVRIET